MQKLPMQRNSTERRIGGATCSPAKLKARFCLLWNRCLSPGTETSPMRVWADLSRHYAEPHRHYHTLTHIFHCLRQLDAAKSLIEAPDAVEIAVWFHDVVHNPEACDNEQRSVELFGRAANGHFQQDLVNKIGELILVTAHREAPRNHDERVLCDIDLASFGSPWDEFLGDSQALRIEQANTPDELFYPAKLKFLKAILERRTIFFTDFFRARYETSARKNIRRYIANLEADAYL
ncbi:MAG: HD domain-containing protein [Gammaproteobacteria bacterium]